MKFITAVAALFVATVANAQVSFTNCASGPTDFAVNTFAVSPLCIGEEVCFTATGTLNNPIVEGATLDFGGKYLGRYLYADLDRDLCALMAAQGHPCPVPTTLTTMTVCLLVNPGAIANVPLVFTVQAANGDGHPVFCQTATLTPTNCT